MDVLEETSELKSIKGRDKCHALRLQSLPIIDSVEVS
jgi:hypothetical protein